MSKSPKPPIEQAKDHILNTCLPLVQPHYQEMIILCLASKQLAGLSSEEVDALCEYVNRHKSA